MKSSLLAEGNTFRRMKKRESSPPMEERIETTVKDWKNGNKKLN